MVLNTADQTAIKTAFRQEMKTQVHEAANRPETTRSDL